MNLVGYGRISSEQRDNTSLSTQMEAIKGFCEQHGHRLVGYYQDTESGESIEGRDNFQWALRTIEIADGLIVFRLDRLTRSSYDGEVLKRRFKEQGKKLISIADAVSLETGDNAFVFTVTAAIAELERGRIRERTKRGLDRKRSEGGYVGGCPPFGFGAYRGKLVELAHEQEIITRVRHWYQDGYSLARIAAILNSAKIPTKKGCGWGIETVRRIVNGESKLVTQLRAAGQILPASELDGFECSPEEKQLFRDIEKQSRPLPLANIEEVDELRQLHQERRVSE